MRGAALALALAATLAGAGCGDDDDGGSSPPEAAAPTTKEGLSSCLSRAGLELKPGSEPYTDAKGQRRTRQGLDAEDTSYAGYVRWPSKRIADVYLAKDSDAAEKAESKARAFVQAFGFDPERYVRRTGTVVMTFDHPPPTDDETKAVEDCAGG